MIIEENKKVIIEKINLKMENIKAITIKLKELFSLVKNGHKFIEGKRNIIDSNLNLTLEVTQKSYIDEKTSYLFVYHAIYVLLET